MRIFADDKVQLEMKKIRLVSAVILMVTFISCGNKSRQAEPIIYDDQPEVELSDPDTISSSVQDEGNKVEEIPSSPVKSSSTASSHSHKSSEYDNMRGFDPASENDMEDNGMSRYMENNDEEGWN
jgi:hypothetical protein